MATLYITEYIDIMHAPGEVQLGVEPETTTQTVSISGSSAASAALNGATRFVRLHTDAICSVLFGTAPTAAATNRRMAANQTEYFAVPQGKSYKVAVITNT